jgi:hypothetical protein
MLSDQRVPAAWGENGSRLFSRVTHESGKYMVVDTGLGLAHGPYSVVEMEQPAVADALAAYMNNYQSEHVAVLAAITPCTGDNPPWNLPTVPKPAYWPPTMPAWPTLPAPAVPGILNWECESTGTAGCRCQIKRKVLCNPGRLGINQTWCEEAVECTWFPDVTPGAPSICPANNPNPPPTQLPVPPGGNSFCDIYWRTRPRW